MKPADAFFKAAQGAFQTPCNAILKLAPTEDASPLWVDARCAPPAVSADAPEGATAPDCEWRGGLDVLIRVLSSKRAVESAVVSGRLVIAGDMSVMARLELAGA